MDKRLYRSRENSVIGGVCAGLGRYLGIDVSLVRLFFVLLALGNGAGVLLYFVLWLILPLEGREEVSSIEENIRTSADEIAARARTMGTELCNAVGTGDSQTALIVGAILIFFGVIFLLRNLFPWLGWLNLGTLWPVLLIALGIALLVRRAKGK